MSGYGHGTPKLGALRRCSFALVFMVVLVLPFCLSSQAQDIVIASVTNSADFRPGVPQNGSLASIFVKGLQGPPGVIAATQYPLSNTLAGVSVWIDSYPAPILAIALQNGYQQINIQVPWETRRPTVSSGQDVVQVSQNGVVATSQAQQGDPLMFSAFFADANGYGVFTHASDNSPVTRQHPALPGEDLIGYGINLGPVTNTPPDGALTPSSPSAVMISSNGAQCAKGFSVAAPASGSEQPAAIRLLPGSVGVYEISFKAPMVATDAPIILSGQETYAATASACNYPLSRSTVTLLSYSVILPVRARQMIRHPLGASREER